VLAGVLAAAVQLGALPGARAVTVDPPRFVKKARFKAEVPRVLAWSPDGARLAVGEESGTIRLVDTASGKRLHSLTGHTAHVTTLAFSSDGRWLASGAGDRTVRLWDTTSGTQARRWNEHRHSVAHVVFDPTGSLWSVAPRDPLLSWRPDRDAPIKRIDVADIKPASVALDPARGLIAEGGDGAVRLRDLGTAEKWSTGFPNCREEPTHLLCAIWRKKYVFHGRIGDVPPATTKGRRPGWYVRTLRLSASGRWVVAGRDDGLIFLLGIDTGRPASSLRLPTATIFDADLGARDRVVAAGDAEGQLWLWTWMFGKEAVTTLKTGDGFTNAVAFSPDGKRLAVANADGTGRIGIVSP
jgi:WD40 repeat protein